MREKKKNQVAFSIDILRLYIYDSLHSVGEKHSPLVCVKLMKIEKAIGKAMAILVNL